jgi:hypothetical protein
MHPSANLLSIRIGAVACDSRNGATVAIHRLCQHFCRLLEAQFGEVLTAIAPRLRLLRGVAISAMRILMLWAPWRVSQRAVSVSPSLIPYRRSRHRSNPSRHLPAGMIAFYARSIPDLLHEVGPFAGGCAIRWRGGRICGNI